MFDEQPDGDPHGECAAEIARLTELVRWARPVVPVYFDWSQRWAPDDVMTYPDAAARLVNAAQDMREALHLILSTTTDKGAREEAARVLAVADAAARVRP